MSRVKKKKLFFINLMIPNKSMGPSLILLACVHEVLKNIIFKKRQLSLIRR